jgi:malonyl-CoA decarboxylase
MGLNKIIFFILIIFRIKINIDSPAYVKRMSDNLRDLLAIWFTTGLLNVERITWQSPCELVERISEYEAVHPIRTWIDLKRRLGPYR